MQHYKEFHQIFLIIRKGYPKILYTEFDRFIFINTFLEKGYKLKNKNLLLKKS